MNESLPNFIVVTSRGFFIADKLNNIINKERLLKVKELMFKSFEKFSN